MHNGLLLETNSFLLVIERTMGASHSGIVFSNEKEKTIDPYNMDKYLMCRAELKKPVPEDDILYDSTYVMS